MRALMVLEESSTSRMLEEYLESRGFHVTVCVDGDSALAACRQEHHALILVDRLLGGAGDPPLCSELRAQSLNSNSIMLVLTVSDQPEDLQALIECGADDYLILPMEPEQLFARLYLAEQRARVVERFLAESPRGTPGDVDLRSIADASPILIWTADAQGSATFFNRAYLEFTGRTLEQECGMGWAESLHPEDYSRCVDSYLAAVRRHDDFRLEFRLRHADGQYRWIHSSGVPRFSPIGEFTGYLGSCVDISDHKRSEAILRSSEERLRLVIKNMPVMMVAFDDAQNIIVWNKECERVTGYRAEEILRKPTVMDRLAPHRDDRDELLARWTSREEGYRDWEMEIYCSGGRIRTVSWSNISDEFKIPGWTAWALGVDITERKRAELEHRRLQAQLQEAQKLESLGVLAGGVAHDFNNLLVGILGKASLARLAVEPDSEAHELLEQVENAAQMAADLTRQMLAYSGKGKFIVEPLSISDVVRGLRHLLDGTVGGDIDVQYRLDPDLPRIDGDATQLQQVVVNLFQNAAEAMEGGGGRLVVRTGVLNADREYLAQTYLQEKLEPGEYCYLKVSDTGCGMDEETIPRIFDPFFSTKFTGRGLGLAAVLGIVRGHHGAVRVGSAPGRGTSVVAIFPRRREEAPSEENGRPKPMTRPSTSDPGAETSRKSDPAHAGAENDTAEKSDGTFLVVDDEAAVRSVARRMLEGMGYDVLCAEDGRQAVRVFRENCGRIDGVLLDMTMPEMDGADTLRELRRIAPDVRVILSSGYSEGDLGAGDGDGDSAAFIQKPYTTEGLLAKIRDVLADVPPNSGSVDGGLASGDRHGERPPRPEGRHPEEGPRGGRLLGGGRPGNDDSSPTDEGQADSGCPEEQT